MRNIPMLAALLSLAACGGYSYTPMRSNAAPLDEALARCRYQANTSPVTIAAGGLSGLSTRDVLHMCMNAEGYRVKYNPRG